MVARKVHVTMTSHVPLPHPLKPPSDSASTSTNSGSNQESGYTHSFVVYLPCAFAQVHVAASSQHILISELRRQVETEVLELKLLRGSFSVN